MGRVEIDTWFFSDQRYRGLIAEERLVLLLVATNTKPTIGVLSAKSGLVHETIRTITNRLLSTQLIQQEAEFFCIAPKYGSTQKAVVVKEQENKEYSQIVDLLFDTINRMKPADSKKLTPKKTDYNAIRLMVEVDKIPVRSIVGILQVYPTIPFWGEKSIVQSASGLRKHWVRIYESAQKHYTKTRIEKI